MQPELKNTNHLDCILQQMPRIPAALTLIMVSAEWARFIIGS